MYHPDDPYSPAERAKRRRLFSSRPPGEPEPEPTTPDGLEHIEQMMESYQATIQQQLEEGLSAIRHTANKLMHEVASEVWRTAGGDKDEVRSRIVHDLSRDQAIRSLIAHSDERFQALAVRTARLEDTLNLVADSVRDAKALFSENLGQYSAPLAAGDTAALRAQLADITREIAGALQALAERDQEVIEAVRSRILEHGQLITSETTRISRAMESYVQHGVEAIGQLAGSMEAQVASFATRDDAVADRVREIVEQQTTLLGEQLQLMYDRMAIDTAAITDTTTRHTDRDIERSHALAEQVQLMYERMAIDTRSINDAVSELNNGISGRVVGIARMVRSDAEALRSEIVRTAQGHDERVAAILGERLGRITTEVEAGTTRLTEELTRRIAEGQTRLTEEFTRALNQQTLFVEQQTLVAEQQARASEKQTHVMEAQTLAMQEQARVMDKQARVSEERARAIEERARTIEEQTRTIDERSRAIEERLDDTAGSLDAQLAEKITGLARLVRSDNVTLAEQISAGQDATKQTLRAMKELQANLPGDVIELVEQRLASLAETIERSNETLAKRIDMVADTIGRRQDTDIQVVIDRMGDAMHALASLGRIEGEPPPRRIELD